MSIFLLPLETIRELESLLSKFWWQFSTSSTNRTIGFNPSFVWRSVLEAQQLVSKGVRWTIEDGKNIIAVLGEPWLPNKLNPMVISSNPSLIGAKASNLLNMNGTDWDTEVLADLLSNVIKT
ncbi:hypothetical protein CsatA_011183 [Cannabis sativa]